MKISMGLCSGRREEEKYIDSKLATTKIPWNEIGGKRKKEAFPSRESVLILYILYIYLRTVCFFEERTVPASCLLMYL